MGRNAGARPVDPDRIVTIMTEAVRDLSDRLPGVSQAEIGRVVYEVAIELVSSVTDPVRLASMLRLRAVARLRAQAGHPIAIRRR